MLRICYKINKSKIKLYSLKQIKLFLKTKPLKLMPLLTNKVNNYIFSTLIALSKFSYFLKLSQSN